MFPLQPDVSEQWHVCFVYWTWFFTFFHLAHLESCWFLNVSQDNVIDFALSTSIKFVAEWGHTGQGWGRKNTKMELTLCKSNVPGLRWFHVCVLSNLTVFISSWTTLLTCFCRSTDGWGTNKKAKQERTAASHWCIHVPLVKNVLVKKILI